MDKSTVERLIKTLDEEGYPYKPYVIERAQTFGETIVSDPNLVPKSPNPLQNEMFLLGSIKGFLFGYSTAVDESYDKDATVLQIKALRAPQWSVIIRDVPEATSAMQARASMLMEGLIDNNNTPPYQYYSVFGFLKGMVAGEADLQSGAAKYFSEKKPEDDLLLEVVCRGATREMLLKYAEDVYILFRGDDEVAEEAEDIALLNKAGAADDSLIDVDKDAEVLELLDYITKDVEDFVRYNCGGMSGANEKSIKMEHRWANSYADHYILGFFEQLFDTIDKEDELESEEYPQFEEGGYDSPANSMRVFMVERGNRNRKDIELAIRHMKVTWDNEKDDRDAPKPEDLYWQVCGLAYVEGVHGAKRSDYAIGDSTIEKLRNGDFDVLYGIT